MSVESEGRCMYVQAGSKKGYARAWLVVVFGLTIAICTFYLNGIPAVAQTNVPTPAPASSPAPTPTPAPTPIPLPTSSPTLSPSPGGSTTQPNAGGAESGKSYAPAYVNVREWLGVLATPLVLAFVVPWLNNRFERTRAQERKAFEKALADERREASRQAALKSYLEQMTSLILDTDISIPIKELPDPASKEKRQGALVVASSLTRAVVAELDGPRNGQVLTFLLEAKLKDVLMAGVLGGIDLRGANLRFLDLRELDLSFALLQGVNFNNSELKNATLVGANLQKANLSETNCELANFADANFQEANLVGAQLEEAVFVDADFSDADIQHAEFWGARLHKANFRTAKNYETAFFSKDARTSAIWPNGFVPSNVRVTG
ncbi:MAG: pentapeptide repeat-containing protein [Cyanobacteria bacterium P01_E01_bin.34]